MTNVYVVGRDSSVEYLFEKRGFNVHAGDVPNEIPDLVVFTGGSDIDPVYYGEENTDSYVSEYSRRRDKYEIGVYNWAWKHGIPKAGICRGGQLFNIMNDGSMVQHIDGHSGGTHDVFEYSTGNLVGRTNSCHHQMMVPTDEAELILYSLYNPGGLVSGEKCPEVIFYRKSKDLCFQAHPEWEHKHTEELFFRYIEEFFGIGPKGN